MLSGKLKRLLASLLGGGKEDSFEGSADYWRQRYAEGGNSGAGSYNQLANFKANFLNAFVVEQGIQTVVEHGCGDGNQLTLGIYPSYLGYDISLDAIELCRARFRSDPTRQFQVLREDTIVQSAELHISLDVIYHLVEDAVFEKYMGAVFNNASRFVVVYSTDVNGPIDPAAPHVRHRKFTDWISRNASHWHLVSRKTNDFPFNGNFDVSSDAEFFVYARSDGAHSSVGQ